MPMTQEEVIGLITEGIPEAKVSLEDLRSDGDHYAVTVESEAFRGLPLVDQHRMVFTALQGRVGGVLRALMLTTHVPEGEEESPAEEGLLPSAPKPSQNMDPNIAARIQTDIRSNPVVLFMKGTPIFPQCSFSAEVVHFLGILGVSYKSIDVLMDPMIRQGIRDFSAWPTIPQLYVRGSFVGGADVIRQMFESGALEELFAQKSIGMKREEA